MLLTQRELKPPEEIIIKSEDNEIKTGMENPTYNSKARVHSEGRDCERLDKHPEVSHGVKVKQMLGCG